MRYRDNNSCAFCPVTKYKDTFLSVNTNAGEGDRCDTFRQPRPTPSC